MTDATHIAHLRILTALEAAFAADLAPLAAFLPSALPDSNAWRHIPPEAKPVIGHLGAARAATAPAFAPLIDAIIAAAPQIHWKTSYTTADGVTEDFMNRYGYFDLATPEGPFLVSDYRLTVAFWGEGLLYPEHWHEPEELYAVIAGDVLFRAAGRAPRRAGPGDFVHHEANQLHATEMDRGPLLAVVGWRGGNLMKFPEMDVSQAV